MDDKTRERTRELPVVEMQQEEYKAIQNQMAQVTQQLSIAQAIAVKEKARSEELSNLVNRMQADFDNYRKRVTKEKADLLKNAGERVLLGLLPIVDDFERGLAAAEADTSAEAVRQGMELIYNKLMKYLESQGVKPMESNGATFDADYFEAIATIPAPSEDLKGKVIDTTQKGYMLNDKVLRHAKVAVGE